jgi:hypothetical protein
MQIRVLHPSALKFMVNPMPVAQKRYRGKQVYESCVHIENGHATTHPYSFRFILL